MDVGGVAELIEVGTTGLLAPPGDVGLLAEYCLSQLARPARLRHMGKPGVGELRTLSFADQVRRIGNLLYSLRRIAGVRSAVHPGA